MSEEIFLSEYGISNESAENFYKRNNYPAAPKFPQNLTEPRHVSMSDRLPFLPIDWETEQDWATMLDEAKRLSKHYVPHRSHEKHKGWASLVIHGISSVHTESTHTYDFTDANAPWRWTDIADLCPTITNFFKTQFDYKKYYRIRIMKLSPGGYIWPHKDSIHINENHIGPVNIALNNPEGCKFFMDNIGYLPWKPGRAIKLNLYNVHSVYNDSNEDRYHIIVHGQMGNSWNERLINNYNIWKKIYD